VKATIRAIARVATVLAIFIIVCVGKILVPAHAVPLLLGWL
jgi:hypothetical protein